MPDALTSQSEANPALPIELCERVIEAVFDDRYQLVSKALTVLCNCALVCRAWRPRAQNVLFEYVRLRDKDALYRFVAILDASPVLGTYVRRLALRGYLHVPYSPAVLFLTALRGRLTNLSHVSIRELHSYEKTAWRPLPQGQKELPYLPFHRYFPSLLASISEIRSLELVEVKFKLFGEFARLLGALPNLKDLHCNWVSWAVFGLEPACMAKHSSHDNRKTFLPNLEVFHCHNMERRGWTRLLAALGPSLRKLLIKFPDKPFPVGVEDIVAEEDVPELASNLRPFPCLDRLTCTVAPFSQAHDRILESFRETLVSWVFGGADKPGDACKTSRAMPSP